MNSEPLSESMPLRAKGSTVRISSSACCTPAWPLPMTARVSTHVVWMSVRLREWRNSPSAHSPEWETRSTSVKPGVCTAQCSVRSGMWCLRSVPGLVRPYRRRLSRRLCDASRRSIYRGLIASSACSRGGERRNRCRAQGSQSGRKALRRTDHGQPAASQIAPKTETSWTP